MAKSNIKTNLKLQVITKTRIMACPWSFFVENGYLILANTFSPAEVASFKRWAEEVQDLPRTTSCSYLQYDEINAAGEQVLCRTENFCGDHKEFGRLLRGEILNSILKELSGEDMTLFKEKSCDGFKVHVDKSGYGAFKNLNHISILISIDASTTKNGCLEIVEGSHKMAVPICQSEELKNTILTGWQETQTWMHVEMAAGDVLIFGTSLAHRSAGNNTSSSRRAVYATHNPVSVGDQHDSYYERRSKMWPSTHKLEEGKNYEEGKQSYAYGTLMLSIEGK